VFLAYYVTSILELDLFVIQRVEGIISTTRLVVTSFKPLDLIASLTTIFAACSAHRPQHNMAALSVDKTSQIPLEDIRILPQPLSFS